MRASLGFFNPFIPTEIIAPNPVIPTVIYGIPHPKARPHFALKSRIWVQIKQIPDPENLLRTVMDGTIDFICFISEGSRFSWNLNIWMSFLRSVRAQTIARFIIIKNPQNQDLIWRIYSECVFLTFKIEFRILSKETQNPFLFKIQECVWIFQTRRTPRNSWPPCLAGALKHLSSHKEKGEINLQALLTINIFRDYSLVKVNLSGHKLILSNYQVIYFMIALNAYRSSAWRRDSNSRRLIWTWKIGTL